MKNKKHTPFMHGVTQFVKRELEISLALLLMLGFVVGFTYADTDASLDNGDVEVTANSWGSGWGVSGVTYSKGIDFTPDRKTGYYLARTGFSPASVTQTTNGTTGTISGQTYTFTLSLDTPIVTTVYLHGDFSYAQVNGQIVESGQTAIALNNVSDLEIHFRGTIKKLALYPDNATQKTAPTIATLYITPDTVTLAVGQVRTFNTTVINSLGLIVSNSVVTWNLISNPNNAASINSATGEILGINEGTVIVGATVGNASASATITVKAVPKSIIAPVAPKPLRDVDIPGIIDSANIDKDFPGASEVPTTVIKDETTTQKSVSNALDAFAEAQKEAIENEDTENTFVNESQVQKILNDTTQGFVERVFAKITLNTTQMVSDIKEIFVGSTTVLEDGTVIKQDSVFQTIGGFFSRLFFGIDASTGEGSAGAATPDRASPGGGAGEVD